MTSAAPAGPEPSTTQVDLSILGVAEPRPERLAAIVAALLSAGQPFPVRADRLAIDWAVAEPLPTVGSAPTTAGLHRVRGVARIGDGEPAGWRMVVKTLRHPRLWPGLSHLSEESQREVRGLDWRAGPAAMREAARCSFEEVPFRDETVSWRTPVIAALVTIDADHMAMWMEDVEGDQRWDDARFERAAFALGLLAARRLGTPSATTPRYGPILAASRQLRGHALPLLSPRADWVRSQAGQLPDVVALRAELTVLGERLEDVVAAAADLYHLPAHGNATPRNLLVPWHEPTTFVAVDWSAPTLLPVGYDLGQLLFGPVVTGELSVVDLMRIAPLAERAHLEGLTASGWDVLAADVHRGFVASAALRSLFALLPADPTDEPTGSGGTDALGERVWAARWLVDQLREILPTI